MAERLGFITLNGKNYTMDIGSYRVTDIIDFAPRAATPGGSILHSELGLYQPLLQTDWRHGFGFHWYEDAMGYLRTEGRVDTRHDGIAMLFTNSTSSDTDNDVKDGFTTFNDAVWAWGDHGLRKYSGGSWSSAYSATSVNFALSTGEYLFYCPDGARIRKVTTGDVHSDAGLDANSTDYKWLIIHNGYIYAGKDGSNMVHYDDNDDLSALEGDNTDTNVIYVGGGGLPTFNAFTYGGNLYISRADGIWQLGEDNVARKVLDFTSEISSSNFRSAVVHNGYVMFPVRDAILQWNGLRYSNRTPNRLTDSFPYTTYGQFDNFTVVGEYLYCTGRTNEATYTESLLCFDGIGWHRLADLITDGDGTISAMGYDAVNDYLWYHHDDGTADVTYYIEFQSLSEFPQANFPTTGTHSLISSRNDMGFRKVKKSVRSLSLEANNISYSDGTGGTERWLVVYYSLDGAAFTEWGGSGSGVISADGVTDLTDPLGTGNSTIEFDQIRIRVDFETNSTTQSPILESTTMQFIMRPEEAYGHSVAIKVATHAEHGRFEDSRTAEEIITDLKTARSSEAPVVFVDPFGVSYNVYVSAIVRNAIEYHGMYEGDYDIEHIATVNLVEV